MALATKCPHCNTTFRVAHDQLKLRGGIVRCGACNEVFDGNAALVDPAPRHPVIIDLPSLAHHDAEPTVDVSQMSEEVAAPAVPHGDAMLEAPAAAMSEAAASTPSAGPPIAASPESDTAEHDQVAPAEGPSSVTDSNPGAAPSEAAAAYAAPASAPAIWRFGAAGRHADTDHPAPPIGDQAPAPDADAMPQQDSAALAAEPDAPVEPVAPLAPELEPDFDLDLNVDEAPATPPAPTEPSESSEPPILAHDEAFDLDFDIESPVNPALAAETPALRDDYASAALSGPDDATQPEDGSGSASAGEPVAVDASHHDGRLEPTLDIPDEHLNAVALHDSFELDAYPHAQDDDLHSIDDRGHSLDGEDNVDSDDENDGDDIVTLSSAAAALAPEPTTAATPVSAREPEEPGFVKRSRRQERWGKASRIAMACALPLLLAGLAYQAVATFRNPLAAAIPALKPALVSACALAGCKVELPSQLDALAIEQGELQTMADNIFSFSTSLRNQSPTAQSWPYIELILNDGADKPVLRRVFAPHDYLPPGVDLASGFLPRSEQPVKLYFELSRVKASGYHIAVFYP